MNHHTINVTYTQSHSAVSHGEPVKRDDRLAQRHRRLTIGNETKQSIHCTRTAGGNVFWVDGLSVFTE